MIEHLTALLQGIPMTLMVTAGVRARHHDADLKERPA